MEKEKAYFKVLLLHIIGGTQKTIKKSQWGIIPATFAMHYSFSQTTKLNT